MEAIKEEMSTHLMAALPQLITKVRFINCKKVPGSSWSISSVGRASC